MKGEYWDLVFSFEFWEEDIIPKLNYLLNANKKSIIITF